MGENKFWSLLKIFLKLWMFHIFIMLFISYIAGVELAKHIAFSQETLLWLTSTIVQAYGAMIAIIIAVGLHQMKEIKEVRQNTDKLINNITDVMAKKALLKARYKLDEKRTRISRIKDPIQAVALLISISIFTMIFINNEIRITPALNRVLAFTFIFLLMFSLYCLQLIINKIYEHFVLDA